MTPPPSIERLDELERWLKGTSLNPVSMSLTDGELLALIAMARSAVWTKIKDEEPAPHQSYQVRRHGVLYTATPCYGLHAPWWVPRVLGGYEGEPVPMQDEDEWRLPSPPEPSP